MRSVSAVEQALREQVEREWDRLARRLREREEHAGARAQVAMLIPRLALQAAGLWRQ